MAHLYIQPPTKEEIVYTFAEWIARLFRVRVTITLDNLSGSRHTIEIAHPDKQAEEMYPCSDCGKLRTKAEGGTTFTVCDECWDKHHKK